MREIGRIERTVHNLDWIDDKGLRADTTDVLNKGEVGTRWRARLHSIGSAGSVTAAMGANHIVRRRSISYGLHGLFNCRYLGRAVAELRGRESSSMISDFAACRRSAGISRSDRRLRLVDSPAYDADGYPRSSAMRRRWRRKPMFRLCPRCRYPCPIMH